MNTQLVSDKAQKNEALFKKVVVPFLTFMAMFIGAGFISGGIVHIGEGFNWWDGSLILIGVTLFVLGSYAKEAAESQKNLKAEGVGLFLFYSLILSIGVGMASGGIQHFIDTPDYSSYLIPIGLAIGVVAFVLKENIRLAARGWKILLSITIVFTLLLGFLLFNLKKALPETWHQDSHSHGDEHPEISENISAHEMMSHPKVANDHDFLIHMIPHHQEAVDTSTYLLPRTENPEMKAFLNQVIVGQTKEIDQMKQWYFNWYSNSYKDSFTYEPMMGDLTKLEGEKLEQSYMGGMIEHHLSAVQMAEEILTITQRAELKVMAEEIIKAQEEEIKLLEGWLKDGGQLDEIHSGSPDSEGSGHDH